MKTEIKFVRFTVQFGRSIAVAQLHEESGKELFSGSLMQILTLAEKEGYEIVNAQEILSLLVMKSGFAS